MLQITVIAVGKLKERFWRDACAEYQKRLSAYAKLTITELPDSTTDQESTLILQALEGKQSARVVLLDIAGRATSSEALAEHIEQLTVQGVSHLVFIIGGSCGVDEHVRMAADERMSFGPITLPHNLARVVLLEQLYRAFKINRGEPYHK